MIGSVLGQVTGQLEKRFVLNALFPTLAFAIAMLLAVSAAMDSGPLAVVESWEADSTSAKVLITIGGVAAIFLAANLLSNGMQSVIRLFEGYGVWPPFIAKLARRRQLARAQALIKKAETTNKDGAKREAAKDRFEVTFPVYPETLGVAHVLPTRLGNILKSAETYAASRYRADSVRLWSRLYPLLPDPITSSMVSARTSMEFLLAVSFLAGIYAPLASIYLIVQSGPLVWILATLVAGTVVSIAAYHASLQPAMVYGEMIRVAFDLHRLDLVKAMAKPVPTSLAAEEATWKELHLLFKRGRRDPAWHYAFPPGE